MTMLKNILLVLILGTAACTTQTIVPPQVTADTGPVQLSTPEANETEILAEGIAAVTSSPDIARDHAIDDALRKAVEQGTGTYISSETEVSNFQLVEDNIYSSANGYVSSYRIIDEGINGGLYRVVIRAMVKTDSIENDLAAIGILLGEQGRPRVMVVFRELSDGESLSDVTMGANMSESLIMDHFRERGFPVVDAATVQRITETDQIKLILQGDDRTAALVGLQAGAEIVVSGTALHNTETRSIAGSQREIHRYQVSSRAVNTATGSLLAASAVTVELPFSETQARSRAADSTAASLETAILQGWVQNSNITEILATGADFAKVRSLRSQIQSSVRGVTDVVTRDLTGSSATIEVVSETSTEEILDALSEMEDILSITGFSGNRIEIQLK